MQLDFFNIEPDFSNFGFTRRKLNTSKMVFMIKASENAPLISLERGGKGSVAKEYISSDQEISLLNSAYSSIRNSYIL